jgi:hypothetical protein
MRTVSNLPTFPGEVAVAEAGDVEVAGAVEGHGGALVVQLRSELVGPRHRPGRIEAGCDDVLVAGQRPGERARRVGSDVGRPGGVRGQAPDLLVVGGAELAQPDAGARSVVAGDPAVERAGCGAESAGRHAAEADPVGRGRDAPRLVLARAAELLQPELVPGRVELRDIDVLVTGVRPAEVAAGVPGDVDVARGIGRERVAAVGDGRTPNWRSQRDSLLVELDGEDVVGRVAGVRAVESPFV